MPSAAYAESLFATLGIGWTSSQGACRDQHKLEHAMANSRNHTNPPAVEPSYPSSQELDDALARVDSRNHNDVPEAQSPYPSTQELDNAVAQVAARSFRLPPGSTPEDEADMPTPGSTSEDEDQERREDDGRDTGGGLAGSGGGMPVAQATSSGSAAVKVAAMRVVAEGNLPSPRSDESESASSTYVTRRCLPAFASSSGDTAIRVRSVSTC